MSSTFADRETVLQGYAAEAERTARLKVIQDSVEKEFLKPKLWYVRDERVSRAIKAAHSVLASRLESRFPKIEERQVQLMHMGAAIERMFQARNVKHFRKLFESEWKQFWA